MLEMSHFEKVCFHAQQAAATSFASLVFLAGEQLDHTPSCIRLMSRLENQHPSLAAFRESAGLLDQVYTSSRYPDDELEVAPYELFLPLVRRRILWPGRGEIVDEAGCIIDAAGSSLP